MREMVGRRMVWEEMKFISFCMCRYHDEPAKKILRGNAYRQPRPSLRIWANACRQTEFDEEFTTHVSLSMGTYFQVDALLEKKV
jgi:hypothetical protein